MKRGGKEKRGLGVPWDNTFLSDNPGRRYSEQNGREQTHTRKSFLVILTTIRVWREGK